MITNFDQNYNDKEKIVFEWTIIGYREKWVENLVVPSLEIISNFPVYKVWSREYKIILRYLKSKKIGIVITRTRFFLTTFIWWVFSRKNKIRWCHIEHGSDYVKLNSAFKSAVAKIYDKIIWKWIFKKTDIIVWVSNACKDFIRREFTERKVEVLYRGVDFPKIKNYTFLTEKYSDKIIVWFVWRLYKWKNIETLIEAYRWLDKVLKNKIQLVIVWDGEDLDRLIQLDIKKDIYFTWWKSFEEALELQSQFDIHFHTSSPGWGLATTLLQAMKLWCFIIATPYEWANEVIVDEKNWILLKDDSLKEIQSSLIKSIDMLEKKKDFASVNQGVIKNKFRWEVNIEKYYKLFDY